MMTLVLSGPSTRRPQATAALRQAGFEVDDSDHPHGFEPGNGESFATVHGSDLDAAVRALEPLGWQLRSHWAQTGPWRKVTGVTMDDPMGELARLKAQLRAAGINLGDV